MRLFIALNIPSDLRARIARDVLTPLQAQLPGARWVQSETLHVTLPFLRERSHAEAEEAKAVLQEVATTQEPFSASLSGPGVFRPARPRVIWLGLKGLVPILLHCALEREHDQLGTGLGL